MRICLAFLLVAGLIVSALPATACYMEWAEINADCEGFSVTVFGYTGEWEDHTVVCDLHLVGPTSIDFQHSFIWPMDGFVPTEKTFPEPPDLFPWPQELDCGSYTVSGTVSLQGQYMDDVYNEFDCPCDGGPGCGTPGYWKNHPDAWPVDEITIGGVTYTRAEAIARMKNWKKNLDKTYTMFAALVAAKLNVLVGNDASCIADVIGDADDWMALYGPVGSGVEAGGEGSPWRDGEPLYGQLDQYNNGKLCAPSRDDLEVEPAPKLAAPSLEPASWGQVKSISR